VHRLAFALGCGGDAGFQIVTKAGGGGYDTGLRSGSGVPHMCNTMTIQIVLPARDLSGNARLSWDLRSGAERCESNQPAHAFEGRYEIVSSRRCLTVRAFLPMTSIRAARGTARWCSPSLMEAAGAAGRSSM